MKHMLVLSLVVLAMASVTQAIGASQHGAPWHRDFDKCTPKLLGKNYGSAAHDLVQSAAPQTALQCTALCCANPKCGGILFQPQSGISWNACVKGKPCCFLKTSVAGAQPASPPNAGEIWQMDGRSQDDETMHFLSATLGSHMVLQRAPQNAVVWGFTSPGAIPSAAAPNEPPSTATVTRSHGQHDHGSVECRTVQDAPSPCRSICMPAAQLDNCSKPRWNLEADSASHSCIKGLFPVPILVFEHC